MKLQKPYTLNCD